MPDHQELLREWLKKRRAQRRDEERMPEEVDDNGEWMEPAFQDEWSNF